MSTVSATEVDQPQAIADLLRSSCARYPDQPAVVGDGRSITYAELGSRSDALAHGLVDLGLAVGDRVAYLGRNATEYWELFFAAGKAGLVIVPLNFRLSAAEVEWALQDCRPGLVLVEELLCDLMPDTFPGTVLVFDQDSDDVSAHSPGVDSYEEWLAGQPASDPHRDQTGDAMFSIMYSSGTTGRPKGVITTVRGLLWAVKAFSAQFDVSPSSASLVPTPYYHIAAGGWSLIAFAAGGRIIQFTEVTAERLLRHIVGHHATHVIMVPTVIAAFIADPTASGADYSSVEHLVYGGSPISETVMIGAQEVFGAKLSQSYGLTETIGVTTLLAPADHVVGGGNRLRSAGRAVPGVELRVVDPVTGTEVPTGTDGEVETRGPGVTPGYWDRPDATADATRPGGWLRTGDIGHLDDDGYLFLRDRLKDMIVSGGENVYPAEVENVIAAHPAVLDVAVIGVPSDTWGETPLAVVVARDGADLDPAELIAFTRERLAHYKCPTAVEIVAALPRNPSGKVLKRQLREQYPAMTGSGNR